MKITIEYYRIFIICGMLTMVSCFFDVPYSIPAVIGFGICGALVALSNARNGCIKAYWKKEDRYLTIPFQEGGKIYAYDDEDNTYKMGILLFPKKVEK